MPVSTPCSARPLKRSGLRTASRNMDSGPSSSRRPSHSVSPASRHKSLRSTDVLSPELPPTYHSLDNHERERERDNENENGTDTDRLLDHKSKRRRSQSTVRDDGDDEEGADGELDALRIDLDSDQLGHGPEAEAMRLASVEQRKALWWRNTLITGLFICSWSVQRSEPVLYQDSELTWGAAQVLFRDVTLALQQVDVLAPVLRLLVPPLCDFLSYDSPVLPGGAAQDDIRRAVPSGRAAHTRRLRVSPWTERGGGSR